MRRAPNLKDRLKIVTDFDEHPYPEGTIVTVFEVLQVSGVVWVKDEHGEMGCLVPDDYVFADSTEK